MDKAIASAAGLEAPRPLSPHQFEQIRRLAYQQFGLDLREGKQELVNARLGKLMRRHGFTSFEQYQQYLEADSSGEALIELIDALTTNFTSFLREPAHFEFLAAELAPRWAKRDQISIWSAACSSGEEPYTAAITLLEQWRGKRGPLLSILATDISTRALATAVQGIYPAERFQSFPAEWMSRYFLRGHGRWEGWYKVKPEVRRLIAFRRLNLIDPFSHPKPFALIFCRNVMIYFDRPTQQQVVAKLAACLEPGGYLFVGHSESLTGKTAGLIYVQPAIYRKPVAGEQPARRPRGTR